MKANEAFTFPKEISIDRFLYENKKVLREMLEENKEMKAKLKRIDAEILRLREYGPLKSDMLSAFDLTKSFLDDQADEMSKDFVEVNSDASDDGLGGFAEASELRRFSEILSTYKQKILSKIESLEKKKQSIKVCVLYSDILTGCVE